MSVVSPIVLKDVPAALALKTAHMLHVLILSKVGAGDTPPN
jgi:hypothetical protein